MRGKIFKHSAAIAALLLGVVLAGCNSGNKEGAWTIPGGAARLNDDTQCIQCHAGRNFDLVTGVDKVTQYLATSPHNEGGLGCESCHGGGAQHNGVGPIPFPLAGLTDTQKAKRCAQCHNGVTPILLKSGIVVPRATDAADLFAVSKHATQPGHFSNGCQSCHTHEGAILANLLGIRGDDTIVRTGPAGTVNAQVLTNALAAFPNVTAGFQCSTCHEHGGGLRSIQARYSAPTGRNTGITVWNPAKTANGVPKNNPFNLCTSCHYMYNYNGTKMIASGTAVSGTLPYPDHASSQTRVYTLTHKEKGMNGLINIPFANMTSAADGTNTRLTGWIIRLTAPAGGVTQADPAKNYATDPYYNGPCYDCHDHEFMTNSGNKPTDGRRTIWSDWGQSFHGAKVLAAKYVDNGADKVAFPTITDYRMQAYSDDAFVGGFNAFGHYNWDSTLKADGTTSDRGACQKCHTATGISNYLNSPTTYDFLRNDYSHLIGWTQVTPGTSVSGGSRRQNEVLYCWGCHRNAASGILRNPGAITTSEYTFNGVAITFPDAGKSNVCVVCHTGRGNNDTIRNTAVASRSASRGVAHHASTGATLFSAQSHVGYEFAGLSYENPSFQHDKIGADSGNGPCASCHMSDSENNGRASHTFQAVSSSTAGVPGKIYGQKLCNSCHNGLTAPPISAATLASERANAFMAAQLLTDILTLANGQTNYRTVNMATTAFVTGAVATINDYGAVQNSLYSGAAGIDPCAYVHNRTYIKRLLFDSIDWAQDGSITGTITVPLTYPGAMAWFKANAVTGRAIRP